MAASKRFGVWLAGERVAELEQRRWPGISCRYAEQVLESVPLNSPLISCSLPLADERLDALAYCQGLLPEGRALESLAARAGLAVNDSFGLLARYGRDIAGALVISEQEPDPTRMRAEPYEGDALAAAVGALEEQPLGVGDDSELSLAGLQDKLLLVRLDDGGWARPAHGYPSTHILKAEDRRFRGMAAAEAQCLALARSLGLTSIEAEFETFEEIPCVIVSRFDRETDSATGEITRVHQEDLCQALGLDPRGPGGRGKYESGGGPSLKQAAGLLEAWARDPTAERERLLAATAFTVLIGNADAHGKNLALLHPAPDEVALAPLYDTVPTMLWPKLRKTAAMSVGAAVELDQVGFSDIVAEGSSWGLARDRAAEVVEATVTDALELVRSGTVELGAELEALVRGQGGRLMP